jgi:hypothetical protein
LGVWVTQAGSNISPEKVRIKLPVRIMTVDSSIVFKGDADFRTGTSVLSGDVEDENKPNAPVNRDGNNPSQTPLC